MNFMNLMMLDDAAQATAAQGAGGLLLPFISIGMLVVVFYFFMYRPQKKQEKETADMRNSIELGDVIVTTGGIIAMVVKVKDDMLLVETSGDRTKLQIQKWAVHSIVEKANEPEVKEVKDVKGNKNVSEAKMKK